MRKACGFGVTAAQRLAAFVQSLEQLDGVVQTLFRAVRLKVLARRSRVRIQEERDFRIYSPGTRPVLRGLAYLRNAGSALLFTRGYTPRLRTYVGREVPRPLRIDISRGDADIKIVLADILALTKLNYNTCLLADGVPVTLRFADSIGEILTAGPIPDETPLPFRHYI